MAQGKSTRYVFRLYIFFETDKALSVGKDWEDRENDNSFWLPKSQIDVGNIEMVDGHDLAEIAIPEWLAETKGLDVTLDGDLEE